MFRKTAAPITGLFFWSALAAHGAVPEGVVKVETEITSGVQAKISLRNDSPKTIVAVALTTEARFADGSLQSQSQTIDWISDLLSSKNVFYPGLTRSIETHLPLGLKGDKPVSAVATLDMVVFEDDTSIGDRGSVARLGASRKSMAALEAADLDQIQKALKAPAPKDAIREMIQQRKARGESGGLLRQVLAQLEGNAPAESLEAFQTALRNYQTMLLAHSALEVK
ncbi:MAG TPA: hypothetical protein VK335_26465 [Bryobacteraceae bacterium]|nr:hypothetical protein [Bryobacteraceae bacterium]